MSSRHFPIVRRRRADPLDVRNRAVHKDLLERGDGLLEMLAALGQGMTLPAIPPRLVKKGRLGS